MALLKEQLNHRQGISYLAMLLTQLLFLHLFLFVFISLDRQTNSDYWWKVSVPYIFIFNYKCELILGRRLTSAEETEKDPGTKGPQLPHSEQLALLALDENLGKFFVNFNGIRKYVVQQFSFSDSLYLFFKQKKLAWFLYPLPLLSKKD